MTTDDPRRWWGKAGERLTEEQARARALARYGPTRAMQPAREAEARRRWAAGKAAPWRITYALDYRNLTGPEVDRACGVAEPAVDMWELGQIYPTWTQLLALAELTRFPVGFFVADGPPIAAGATSMRFHYTPIQIEQTDQAMAREFTLAAITATLRAEGVLP